MRTSIKSTVRKTAAVTLALAMALSVAPMTKSAAKKVKKPTINYKGTKAVNIWLEPGEKATLIVKKGTYKVKSTKWSSTKNSVATVSKKGIVTAKTEGETTIKAVVTTKKTKKKTKKYTLKTTITVVAPEEVPYETWLGTYAKFEEDTQALLDKAYDGRVGVFYKGIAVLGILHHEDETQCWRFLVKTRPSSAEGTYKYQIIQVHENGDEVTVEKTIDTGIEAPGDESLEGGWSDCADPSFSKEEHNLIEGLMDLESYYDPVAKIAEQVVAGMNYRVVIQKKATETDAKATYIFVNVYKDLNGEFQIDPKSAVTVDPEA